MHTILANNGYTVHDLGKQVPMNTILEKAVEVDADAIGLSALLVSTSKQMPVCVAGAGRARVAASRSSSAAPRSIAISAGASRCSMTARGYFEPGLFYAKDAFEGLELVDALTGDPQRAARPAANAPSAKRSRSASARATPAYGARPRDSRREVAAAPTFRLRRSGARACIDAIDVRELWPCFDLRSLYRLSWGGATRKGAEFERLVREEFEPRLPPISGGARGELLQPRIVYGYFPRAGLGDDVILYDRVRRARSRDLRSRDKSAAST